jgi:Bacterial protein of unknown function (DUF916)
VRREQSFHWRTHCRVRFVTSMVASSAIALTAIVAAGTGPVAAATPSHPGSTTTTAPSSTTTTTPSDITWSIQPSTAHGPTGRPSFIYTNITAGSRLKSYVGVTNYSAFPVTFTIYAADGVNTPNGGFDVLQAGKKSVGVGAWTTLAKSQVTVPAGLEENVPFVVKVPANATPGDHFGGIVAQVSTSSASSSGSKFVLDRRVGTRIYLRVAGKLHPSLSVEHVGIAYRGTINPVASGTATVDYTVKNTGNVALASPQVVSVTSLFGTLATVDGHPIINLLPGQSAHFVLVVKDIPPAGPITAHVTLVPGEPKGTTTPPVVKLEPPAVVTAQSGGTWAWPWPQLIVFVFLIALLWLWGGRGRRRRKKQAAAVAAAKEEGRRQAEAELKERQEANGTGEEGAPGMLAVSTSGDQEPKD